MKFGRPMNANTVLRGNGDNIQDLHVHAHTREDGLHQYSSLWYPSERERLHILAGLPIQVHVVTAGPVPALAVDVSSNLNHVAESIEP